MNTLCPAPLLFVVLLACADKTPPPDPLADSAEPDTTPADDTGGGGVDTGPFDLDGDGFTADEDCDDARADIHPGAAEVCNDLDDNCNDEIDEGLDSTWYVDADGDGDGDPATAFVDCDPGKSGVLNNNDCDDTTTARSTSAEEVCENALDDNCNYEVDEGCIPSGDLTTALAQTTYSSGKLGDLFGTALSVVPDWTGDGVPDIAIGAPSDNTIRVGPGVIYFFSGADTGSLVSTDIITSIQGAGSSDAMGELVTTVPDLNGDGSADLLVGSTGWSNGSGRAATGLVSIITGLRGTSVEVAAEWEGTEDYANFGLSGTAADLDGDGSPELLLGACDAGASGFTDTGRVYVVESSKALDGGPISSATALDGPAGSYAGCALSRGVDLDGDGDEEVIVGSRGYTTSLAWLLDGLPDGGDLEDWTVATFTGTAGNYGGFVVEAPADLDGDGYVDLAISVPWDDTATRNAGAVYIFDGTTRGTTALSSARMTLLGESTNAYAASALTSPGDFDGDGLDDLLVGAKWEDGFSGQVYVVAGTSSGTLDLGDAWIRMSSPAMDQLGIDLDASADFSGDGIQDLVISAVPATTGISTVFRWEPGR